MVNQDVDGFSLPLPGGRFAPLPLVSYATGYNTIVFTYSKLSLLNCSKIRAAAAA